MKLYELHRGELFTINPIQEDDRYNAFLPKEIAEKLFKLDHIDGMYSYVTDTEDNVYHFAAWTEVNEVK